MVNNTQPNSLAILLWNANGIKNNINELLLVLDENYIDIVIITESHLTSRSQLVLQDYEVLTANHPDDSAHAGAALLVSKKLKHSPFLPKSTENIQVVATSIIINSIPTSIISAYCPPGCDFPDNELSTYIQSLNHTYIIGSDFNAKHNAWGSRYTNTRGRRLYNLINNHHARILSPSSPTYWPTHVNRHPDILDFFFTNMPRHFQPNILSLCDPASDHTPVVLKINSVVIHQIPPRTQINWNLFRNKLEMNTSLNVKLKTSSDIDNAINSLVFNIHDAAAKASIPVNSKHKNNISSPEILDLIKEKRRARNIWQHSHYPTDKQRYNALSNKLKYLLKKKKVELYNAQLQSLSPTNGSLWRKSKSLLRHKIISPPLKLSNNNYATTDQEKADLLASHLSSVFRPHNIVPDADHLDKINQFINSPLPIALPAKHTSPAEVLALIRNLKNNKSPGHDKINNKLLKNIPPKTIILLTYIYNATLRLSYFPTTWKTALIVTILKPGKPPDDPSSYRPISLLPALGKILEKIILKRIIPMINQLNYLPDFQFGFRSRHSTYHQLNRVIDHVAESLETKKYCSGVFLDVAQAFDTVWYDGLLYKIKRLLPAPYYLLIKSFLENRTFNVRINTTLSNSYSILAGVPQGSDIAPLLYIIYTADIPTNANTLIGTYADDTVILASNLDPTTASQHVQTHLNTLSTWFKNWKININETKSIHMTFSLRPQNCPQIFYNGKTIPHQKEAKYLGLILDRRLTWGPHLKEKRKQLNSRLHMIRPLFFSKIHISNLLTLYKSLLQPIWSYGVLFWGTAKPSNLRTIQAFQSICLRTVTKAPWFVTNKQLHNDLKVKTVKDVASLYYSRYHSKLANHPNNLVTQLGTRTLPNNPLRRLKRSWCRDLLN